MRKQTKNNTKEVGKVCNEELERLEFFRSIFPKLGNKEYIEIRAFKGSEVYKQDFYNSIDKALEGIKKVPNNIDVFYGLGTRNKKKGTAQHTDKFNSLCFDCDPKHNNNFHIDIITKVFNDLKIEYNYIINSGNGYHVYLLLDKPYTYSEVERVVKVISKEINSDPRATDEARIFRVPFSFNNKGRPIKTTIEDSNTSKRHTIEELKAKLNINDNILKQQTKPKKQYMFNYDRACINNIMAGVEEGYRNFALGRLTKYFQQKGKTKEEALEIIIDWNTRNEPQEKIRKLKRDFNSYWETDYKLLGCNIKDNPIQDILYRFCDNEKCSRSCTVRKLNLDNVASYNNRLFDIYSDLTGNDLLVYGILVMFKNGLDRKELEEKLKSRVTGKPSIKSNSTIAKVIKTLKSKGLIKIKKGVKRNGKSDFYKAQKPYSHYGKSKGYTLVSNGALMGAIDGAITPAQFKLYILLLKYAYAKSECFPAMRTLANDLGIKNHSRVDSNLKALEKASYINIRKQYVNPRISYSIYDLLI